MTVISLAHQNISRSCSAYKKEICKKNKIRAILAMVLIFGAAAVIFLYVLQTNIIASSGYKINELRKQFYNLEENNRALQINISNLKSINNIQLKAKDFNMIQAQDIEYVALLPDSGVAAK